MMLSYGLKPIFSENATVLILGSMPGIKSLKQQEYYAHPRNAFWYILDQLIGIDVELDYVSRISQLKQTKIALWDVIASCHRSGSLDSAITSDSIKLNPIDQFILNNPSIRCICLNGGKAFELFERFFIKTHKLSNDINYIQLPSTSPAHARLSKEQKCQLWQNKLRNYI